MSVSKNLGNTISNISDGQIVPGVDSLDNILARDVVGNKNDLVSVPYTEAKSSILSFLHTGYYHVHGVSFVYPNHVDDVNLVSGAGAWNLTGALTQVIPAGVLSLADFDLHWINISGISATSTIQIDIYAGAPGSEVLIGATRANRTTSQDRNGPARIQIPQQIADTRISCRLSDSSAGSINCNVSFEGHYYA